MASFERVLASLAVLFLCCAVASADKPNFAPGNPGNPDPSWKCNFNIQYVCPVCQNTSPTTYCATGNAPNGVIFLCDANGNADCVAGAGSPINCTGDPFQGQCAGGGVRQAVVCVFPYVTC